MPKKHPSQTRTTNGRTRKTEAPRTAHTPTPPKKKRRPVLRPISEDDLKRAEKDLQKETDAHVEEIDKLLATKEQELREV